VRRALERRLAEAFDPDGVFAPAIPPTAVAPGAADPHPDAGGA
jgi:hypothetical protein